MKPPATTNPLVIIAVDLLTIAIQGPKYLVLAGALWLAKRKYVKSRRFWN